MASAVTKGDLTQMIRVEAKGEVEELKDTINQMIANLKQTTLRNQEQDWLKSNLAKFTQMLQGQKDLNTVTQRILSELAQVVNAHKVCSTFWNRMKNFRNQKLKLFAAYAFGEEVKTSKRICIRRRIGWTMCLGKRKNFINECSKELYQRSVPVLEKHRH